MEHLTPFLQVINVAADCIRLISLDCEADILGKIFLVVTRTGEM